MFRELRQDRGRIERDGPADVGRGARQGCTALLSGNIGEKCSVGGFSLVRTAHPRTVHPADFWSLKAPPRGRAQGRKIKNLSPLQGKPGLFAMPTLDRANGQ